MKAKFKNKTIIAGQDAINDVMSLDTIKTLSTNTKSPSVKFVDASWDSDGAEAHYITNAEGTIEGTNANTGHKIEVYRSSFKNYRYLTKNILHEFGHAYSRTHNIFASNYNIMGGNWHDAIMADELFAYSFQDQFGFSFYEGNSSLYVYGLRKALNNFNFDMDVK